MRPRRLQRGTRIGTKWLDNVRAAGVYRATGQRARTRQGGGNLVITQPTKPTGLAIMAKVVAINDDDLQCTFYTPNETESGRTIYVAKPYLLQVTPFDGETIDYPSGQSVTYTYTNHYTRTADDGSDVETQVVTPEWFVGEIVDAYPIYTETSAGGGRVHYREHPSGRHWAATT